MVLLGAALLLGGILTAAADTEAPLHDWTIRVHGGAYGFTSCAPGHWNMYVGRLVDPGASLTFQYAATLSSMLLLAVGSCWLSVGLMRIVPLLLPNPRSAADAGLAPCPRNRRPWSRAADSGRSAAGRVIVAGFPGQI
jgi:hypothetical protein